MAAGRVHRHRRARLQPRRGALAQAARRAHRALRQPVGLGLAREARGEDRRAAPTACCACSRWSRRSTRGTASTRASSAIRWPTRCRCEPDRGAARAQLGLDRGRAGAGAAAGQPRWARSSASAPIFLDAAARVLAQRCPACRCVVPAAERRAAARADRRASRRGAAAPALRVLDGHARAAMIASRRGAAGLGHRHAGGDAGQAADGGRLPRRAADLPHRQGRWACSRSTATRCPTCWPAKPLVPELMQHDCTPENLAAALLRWLRRPAAAARAAAALPRLHLQLRRDASARAADAVAELLRSADAIALSRRANSRCDRRRVAPPAPCASPASTRPGAARWPGRWSCAAVVFAPGPHADQRPGRFQAARRASAREELYARIVERAWPGTWCRSRSRRSTASTSSRRRCSACAARSKAWCTRAELRAHRRQRAAARAALPGRGAGSAATRATARSWPPRSWPRSRRDRHMVDLHAQWPAVRLRRAQGLCHARSTSPRCASTAPARSTAAASRRCAPALERDARASTGPAPVAALVY